jgi:hypothetical protein
VQGTDAGSSVDAEKWASGAKGSTGAAITMVVMEAKRAMVLASNASLKRRRIFSTRTSSYGAPFPQNGHLL